MAVSARSNLIKCDVEHTGLVVIRTHSSSQLTFAVFSRFPVAEYFCKNGYAALNLYNHPNCPLALHILLTLILCYESGDTTGTHCCTP